jgi:peptidoglycan/xylan/chitin deacetylase (PgdA/CDA1 family)
MHEAKQPRLQVARFPGNARCAVTTSWDDNDSGNMEIMKILDSMNLKGTFYVDPGNPHGTPRWASDGLTDSDLRALTVQHEVGSHTWSHVDVRRCDVKRLREELVKSKEYLENITGRPVFGFAYPYGAHTPVSQKIVKECGYLYARTTVQANTNFPPTNPYLWGISVWALDISPSFLKHIISRTILNRAGRMYVRNLAWDWRRLASKFFEKAQATNGVFHIWGHAVEVLKPRLRRQLIEACSCIAFRKDVWYTTNSMLFLNDLLRNSVHISHDQDSDTRRAFRVHAKRPPGISSAEFPIPLHVSVPENWKDFAVDLSTVSGSAKMGKLAQQAWIDIYGDDAEVTVSRT